MEDKVGLLIYPLCYQLNLTVVSLDGLDRRQTVYAD